MKLTSSIVNKFLASASIAFFSVMAVSASNSALAQDSEASSIEEIIVQAQKRDQSLSDVPVAVTAISGAEIEAAGIFDMFNMQQNVPGLIVGQSQTATSSNFSIRGLGSSANNFGVESSVGLYVDGVYRSRQGSMINELIDLEAAEVLRGPQGTLFGKNTAAGAILLRTVAPEAGNANAFINVESGNYGLSRFSAATNIDLKDNLTFRGTVFSTHRDGYVSDIFLGDDLYNDRDRQGIRLQLALNDRSDDFNARLIVDYSELNETCCAAVSRIDGIYSQASIPQAPNLVVGSDAALLSLGGTIAASNIYPAALLAPFGPAAANVRNIPFEDFRISQNFLPHSSNNDSGISLEINRTVGELMFSSITGYRSFDTDDDIDADFTNVDVLRRINSAQQSSLSQEFRLSGDIGDKGSFFQAGLYFFQQDLNSLTNTLGGSQMQDYVLALQPDLVDLINGTTALVAGLPAGTLPAVADPFPSGFFVTEDMQQKHNSWAIFGQTDIVLSEMATLILGARYTDERKSILGVFTQSANGAAVPDLTAMGTNLAYVNPASPAFGLAQPDPTVFLPILAPNAGWGGYAFDVLAPRPGLDTELEDSQVTGTAKLVITPSDAIMLYSSYATGYKAGGTNTDRINPALNPIFGPEKSQSLELGFKGNWDNLRLGVSVYKTNFDDFQANSFTGTGFNLQNAGKIETDGWEIDYSWQPLENTNISGYFARSTGIYKSFLGGTCRDAFVFHTGNADPGGNGNTAAEVCDRSGDKITDNPENRAFVALTQTYPVSIGSLFLRAEYSHFSEKFTDGDNDPFTLTDDINLLNIRMGLDIDSWDTRVTLWGRNVADVRAFHGSFDQPLGQGRMNSYPMEPRTYGMTITKNWN